MVTHYFDGFNPTAIQSFNTGKTNTVSKNTHFFSDGFPKQGEIDVALIGCSKEVHTIREQLYQFQFPFRNLKFGDLGNIKKGDPVFLNPAVSQLLEKNVVPIILSSDFDLIKPLSLVFEQRKQHYNVCLFNRFIPVSTDAASKTTLNNVIEREKAYLGTIDFIGFQEHYCDTTITFQDHEKLANFVALGSAKNDLEEVEPYIRNASLACFDVNVMKWADAPGQYNPAPSGFTSEEVCQLSRYAGINENLSCIFFHGYDLKKDTSNITAKTIAENIWYFLDGVNVRNLTDETEPANCTEYMVDSKYLETPIVFVRNNQTNKWWFHFQYKKSLSEINTLLACSYEDYLGACNEELSDRMVRAIKKFAHF